MVGLIVLATYFLVGIIVSVLEFKYGDVVDEFTLNEDIFIGTAFAFCVIIWPVFVIFYIITQLGKFIRIHLFKKQ